MARLTMNSDEARDPRTMRAVGTLVFKELE
jgi:hypothetical protein